MKHRREPTACPFVEVMSNVSSSGGMARLTNWNRILNALLAVKT